MKATLQQQRDFYSDFIGEQPCPESKKNIEKRNRRSNFRLPVIPSTIITKKKFPIGENFFKRIKCKGEC